MLPTVAMDVGQSFVPPRPRRVGPSAAPELAALLHDFNVEFDEPSPGPDVLAARLDRLLASDSTLALLAGEPAIGLSLLTLRSNVWYDVPVALLDELYVVPAMRGHGTGTVLLDASCSLVRSLGVELLEINVDGEDRDTRRFYEAHGFSCMHGHPPEPELYYSRELT
jgi:GNAT superfamily N-acetyltransferase